jgi:hypothetical protein
LVAAFALSACARSAPQLPPDYGSVDSKERLSTDTIAPHDRALTCSEIKDEMAHISNQMDALNRLIESKHGSNQTTVYFSSVLFPPAALAADDSQHEKKELDANQQRWDKLIAVKRVKGCKA